MTFTEFLAGLELGRRLSIMIDTAIKYAKGTAAVPQKVRWGPADGMPAGIKTWSGSEGPEAFIAWDALAKELIEKLLPQLFAEPSGYRFALSEHNGKKDWLVTIVDEQGKGYCCLWLGINPDSGWEFDGLVRVGGKDTPYVWQTYERYSDGTYRRRPSPYRTLEEARERSGV